MKKIALLTALSLLATFSFAQQKGHAAPKAKTEESTDGSEVLMAEDYALSFRQMCRKARFPHTKGKINRRLIRPLRKAGIETPWGGPYTGTRDQKTDIGRSLISNRSYIDHRRLKKEDIKKWEWPLF